MSTGKMTFLQDAQTDNIMEVGDLFSGAAKAWGNFNASDVILKGSFNTSSVIDNSVGDYSPQWTAPFVDAGYTSAGGSESTTTYTTKAGGYAVGSLGFNIVTTAGALIDKNDTTFVCQGDLA